MTLNTDVKGDTFTVTTHEIPYPTIISRPNSLPSPFHVCIIGASHDIGAYVAFSFAKAGATAISICASAAEIEVSPIPSMLRRYTRSTHLKFHLCDITIPSEVEAFASKIQDEFGHVDVLVYTADYFGSEETRVASTPHDFATALEVNCNGLYLATHFMLPLLKKSPHGTGGAVIAISSDEMHATGGPGHDTAYSVSKLAQCRYIEMLAAMEPDIFTAVVHPGDIESRMGRYNDPEGIRDDIPNDPYLCADFILWLTKERRMWLSGRYLSSNWDVDELASREADIVGQDKLKMRMVW